MTNKVNGVRTTSSTIFDGVLPHVEANLKNGKFEITQAELADLILPLNFNSFFNLEGQAIGIKFKDADDAYTFAFTNSAKLTPNSAKIKRLFDAMTESEKKSEKARAAYIETHCIPVWVDRAAAIVKSHFLATVNKDNEPVESSINNKPQYGFTCQQNGEMVTFIKR